MLPSATTYEMNKKLSTGIDEFSILSEIKLKVIEPEDFSISEFKVLFFNCSKRSHFISLKYLIPESMYSSSLTRSEVADLLGMQLASWSQHERSKDVIDVNDTEPEMYPNSLYKRLVFSQEVFNVNQNGHQFRTNVSGRSKIYKLGRMSAWDIKPTSSSLNKSPSQIKYIENIFNSRDFGNIFSDAQQKKLIEHIEAFCKNNSQIASLFEFDVTSDIAPDYHNIVPVEMNLSIIKDNILSQKYRSQAMLMFDVKLIEENCSEFNAGNDEICKDAKKLHEGLKKSLTPVLSNRLRSVSLFDF